MGNYNSHYESYYNNITNKKNKRNDNYYNRGSRTKSKKNFITRRIIQDLCGVLVLFLFILVCKGIVTSPTKAAYKYSKEVVNTNYDYKKLIRKVKSINKSQYIKIKAKKIKNKIREKLSVPYEKEYISSNIMFMKEKKQFKINLEIKNRL